MSYIGNTPTTQSFISGTDYFNGTGAQTAFTLSRTVASVNDIEAVVNNVVQQPNDAYTISGTTITFTSAPSSGTNNVYVRYLSTTTQAITPSQGTVSWNTLNSDVQQDLGISFKNRIINGNMAIDQRNAGASVTVTTAQSYGVDRFFGQGSITSKFTAQQSTTAPAGFINSWLLTSSAATTLGASDYYYFGQNIEGLNCTDLGWGTANAKTVTLSFQVYSSLTGTFSGAILNSADNRSYAFTYSIPTANTWTTISVTIAGDTSGTWLTTNGVGIKLRFALGAGSSFLQSAGSWGTGNVVGATGTTQWISTNGATFYITGVQLEVGTQATTFTTAGGSYGAELALCQRYYYKTFDQSTAPANGVSFQTGIGVPPIGTAYTISALRSLIIFPQVMRATPSITFFNSNLGTPTTGSWSYYSSSWTASTATNVGESSQLYVSPNIDKSASFTSGNSYLVTGFLTASAEL